MGHHIYIYYIGYFFFANKIHRTWKQNEESIQSYIVFPCKLELKLIRTKPSIIGSYSVQYIGTFFRQFEKKLKTETYYCTEQRYLFFFYLK